MPKGEEAHCSECGQVVKRARIRRIAGDKHVTLETEELELGKGGRWTIDSSIHKNRKEAMQDMRRKEDH